MRKLSRILFGKSYLIIYKSFIGAKFDYADKTYDKLMNLSKGR